MKYSCSCFQPLALTVKKPKGTFLTSWGCLKIEFSKNYPNNKAVKIQLKPDFHGFYLTFESVGTVRVWTPAIHKFIVLHNKRVCRALSP